MIVWSAGASRMGYLARRRASWLTGVAVTYATAIPLCIISGTSAWGDNINWRGGGTSWFDGSNWSSNTVPGPKDTAYIYTTGPTIGASGAQVSDLVVAGPDGSFTVSAGGSFSVRIDAKVGSGRNNFGTATITGPGAVWNVGTTVLGNNEGIGTIVISAGGQVLSGGVELGDRIPGNSITVTGAGSELYSGYGVNLNGGTLTISDGATVRVRTGWRDVSLDSRSGDSAVYIGAKSTNPADAQAPGIIAADRVKFTQSPLNSLNFNHTDVSRKYEFAPLLVGNGVVNFYNGATVLTGQSTGFTGTTNIYAAATTVVKGSLENANTNVWGVLAGNGNAGTVTIHEGGRVEPGNSVGTLTINGNLKMDPGSEYRVELNGSRSDLIQVLGFANVQSTTFRVDHDTDASAPPVLPGKTYTILTTGRGLTIATPKVGIADFPFLGFYLTNDGFNGYLTTARSADAFASLASTSNEKAVANALDTAGPSSPAWQQVVGATAGQARAAFTSLSNAAIHANATGVMSEQSRYLRDAVTDRLRQDFAYGTGLESGPSVLSYAPETTRNAYAAAGAIPYVKAPPVAAVQGPLYAAWAQGVGSRGSLGGDGNASRTDHSLGGVISGIDVTFNGQWRMGVAGGYSQSNFSSPGFAASGSSESYHIALYGGGQFGAWGLRGGATFSWNDIVTTRQVAVVNLNGIQRGAYTTNTTQVFGELGHRFRFGASIFEPFANVAYVRVDGNINETGLLAVTGSSVLDTTYTTLGLRGGTALTQMLTARGMLGWRHALGDISPVAALAFQSGGTAFALNGSPIARDALVAEAGLDLALTPNASIGVSWSGQFANGAQNNAIRGNLIWRF